MKGIFILTAIFFLVAAGTGMGAGKEIGTVQRGVSPGTKVGIQVAVLDFIQGEACEVHGVCKFGTLRARYSRLLDDVKKEGETYLAYAEFTAGKDVFTVEYHVKKKGGSYAVVKEVIFTRNGAPVNEVLWEGEPGDKR